MNNNPFLDPKKKIYKRTGEEAYQDYLDKLKNGGSDGDKPPLPPNPDDTNLTGKITGDDFVFNDVKLVAPDGRPFAEYEQIMIPNKSMKNSDGEYIRQTWSNWNNDFNTKDELWLNFPLFYHVLEWAWKNKSKPEAEKIKESFKEDYSSWIALGTRFSYDSGNDSIVHKISNRGKDISLDTSIPRTGRRNKTRDIQNSNDWKHFLQTLTGKQDTTNLADVLEWASDRDSYIWTSNTEQGERAAFAVLSGGDGGFFVDCYGLDYVGRSRGVRAKIFHKK